MSKKKKRRKHQPQGPGRRPRLAVGTAVRVKPGTAAPDDPGLALDGWTGTVREVARQTDPPSCRVAWDQATLDRLAADDRQRRERDGLPLDSLWLREDALEPVGGAAVRPPMTGSPDDRLRQVFGLAADQPLPDVNEDSLRKYHAYLAPLLTFPFRAGVLLVDGPDEIRPGILQVVALLGPEEADEDDGLLCQVVVEGGDSEDLPLAMVEPLTDHRHRRRLLNDYKYWFFGGPDEASDETSDEDALSPVPELDMTLDSPQSRVLLRGLLGWTVWVALWGAALGSLLMVVDGAGTGATVGAVLLGLIGLWLGRVIGIDWALRNGLWPTPRLMGAMGVVVGALAGAVVGAMLAAFVGPAAGGLAGAGVGWVVRHVRRGLLDEFRGGLLGAGLGALVQSFRQDYEPALNGATWGAASGVGLMLLLGLFVLGLPVLMGWGRRPD